MGSGNDKLTVNQRQLTHKREMGKRTYVEMGSFRINGVTDSMQPVIKPSRVSQPRSNLAYHPRQVRKAHLVYLIAR